jgi:hypothetical protein
MVQSQPGQESKQDTTSKMSQSLVSVAYTCNFRYSGGRDQEDHGSRPGWPVCETLSRKYPHIKGLAEWLNWYSACLANVTP